MPLEYGLPSSLFSTGWGFGPWVGPRHRCQTLRLHCWSHPAVAFGRPCLYWRRCEAKGPLVGWITLDHGSGKCCVTLSLMHMTAVLSEVFKIQTRRSSSSISAGCGQQKLAKGNVVLCMLVVFTPRIPPGHMFDNLEEQILISGSGPATHLPIPHLLEIDFLFTVPPPFNLWQMSKHSR